jgi:hypothetical protein
MQHGKQGHTRGSRWNFNFPNAAYSSLGSSTGTSSSTST